MRYTLLLGLLCSSSACSLALDTDEAREIGAMFDAGPDVRLADAGPPADTGTDARCPAPELASPPIAPAESITAEGNFTLSLTGDACEERCFVVTVESIEIDVCVLAGASETNFWYHVPIFDWSAESDFVVGGEPISIIDLETTYEFARNDDGILDFTVDGAVTIDIANDGTAVFATTLVADPADVDETSDIYRWNRDGSLAAVSESAEIGYEPRISDDGRLVVYFDDDTPRFEYDSQTGSTRGGLLTDDGNYRVGEGTLALGHRGADYLIALGTESLNFGEISGATLATGEDVPLMNVELTAELPTECPTRTGPSFLSVASSAASIFMSYTTPCVFYYSTAPIPQHTHLTRGGSPIMQNDYSLVGTSGQRAGFQDSGILALAVPGGGLMVVGVDAQFLVDADDDFGFFIFRTDDMNYSLGRRDGNTVDLELLNVDENGMPKVAPTSANALSPVAISPDGHWVAYAILSDMNVRFARARVH